MKRGSTGRPCLSTKLQTANVVGWRCRRLAVAAQRKAAAGAVQPCNRLFGALLPWAMTDHSLRHFLLGVAAQGRSVNGRMAWVFLWAFTGKQYRRCGVHRERIQDVKVLTHVEPRLRTWIASDSGSVVMKVDIRSEVCNNSPAEAVRSENEWRSRVRRSGRSLKAVSITDGNAVSRRQKGWNSVV